MGKEKIVFIASWIILLIVILNGFNYKEVEEDYLIDNFPESELVSLKDVRQDFREGHGIIQIKCTNLQGDGKKRGGVYVSVNGTIKLNITTSDPRNLKVKVGDVIIVKGHNLSGQAVVTITDVAGYIDFNHNSESISVGNLAKYFTRIREEALD